VEKKRTIPKTRLKKIQCQWPTWQTSPNTEQGETGNEKVKPATSPTKLDKTGVGKRPSNH